jgi:hypothetical protein
MRDGIVSCSGAAAQAKYGGDERHEAAEYCSLVGPEIVGEC